MVTPDSQVYLVERRKENQEGMAQLETEEKREVADPGAKRVKLEKQVDPEWTLAEMTAHQARLAPTADQATQDRQETSATPDREVFQVTTIAQGYRETRAAPATLVIKVKTAATAFPEPQAPKVSRAMLAHTAQMAPQACPETRAPMADQVARVTAADKGMPVAPAKTESEGRTDHPATEGKKEKMDVMDKPDHLVTREASANPALRPVYPVIRDEKAMWVMSAPLGSPAVGETKDDPDSTVYPGDPVPSASPVSQA